MSTLFTCECMDGRTVTGSSRWEPAALKRMTPPELVEVLAEMKEFSRYYEATFYLPIQSLQQESERLRKQLHSSKTVSVVCGIVTGTVIALWLLCVILPFLRFSGLTLLLAVLTFISIIILIPVLFRSYSIQEDMRKRLPRINAKLERLLQKQEKEIFGTYIEYLIGGFLLSPEYSLSVEALCLMMDSLQNRTASTLSEAAGLCRKQFPRSPIPKLIRTLRSGSGTARRPSAANKTPKTGNLSNVETEAPDLQVVLQLSEYLHSAVKNYAAMQKSRSAGDETVAATLSYEEESLISEYRYLSDEERKRIRRIVHSFRTKES